MPQPLIFPLNRVSKVDVAALQAKLRAPKLLQAAFMQQRSREFQGSLAPKMPVNMPWNSIGLPSLIDIPTLIPHVVHQLLPYPPTFFTISGQTKDSNGAILGNCVVDMFDTATDTFMEKTTSNADGYFYFKTPVRGRTYRLVAYKAGGPDVAGTTVNTLTGT